MFETDNVKLVVTEHDPENFLTRTVRGMNHEYEMIMLQQQEVMRKEIARVYDAIHGLRNEHFSSKTEVHNLCILT